MASKDYLKLVPWVKDTVGYQIFPERNGNYTTKDFILSIPILKMYMGPTNK